MMLLTGSQVDDAQRTLILSAAGGRQAVNAEQDTDAGLVDLICVGRFHLMPVRPIYLVVFAEFITVIKWEQCIK